MFWKSPKLTKREQEIRDYVLQEYSRVVDIAADWQLPLTDYDRGEVDAAATILGNVLDILGG